MQTFFGPDFFAANRSKLRAAIGGDTPIVITGNGNMQKGGDEAFTFHQDSSFWYLTGLSTPDLTLVIGGKDVYLIAPTLSFERAAFDGANDPVVFAGRSGITEIVDSKTGWAKLRSELAHSSRIATLLSPPLHMKRHGLYTLPFRRQLIAKLKRINPSLTVQDIRTELAYLRSLKQPEELLALQRAIDITSETIADIRKPDFLQTVTSEYQLDAAITYGFRSRGSAGSAFDNVVAAGKHATTLHHMENNGPIEPGDLIVVDIGASVEHYAADITRTISSRPLTGRRLEVFTAVEAVQDFALSHIKPGVLPLDYEKAVEVFMGTKLLELGVITEASRENIRHYYPHATSHFLGLDTHDAGDYQKPYEAGMVITCEPGIYIPEEGIGVRIEDDILLTDDGNKILSRTCPRKAF